MDGLRIRPYVTLNESGGAFTASSVNVPVFATGATVEEVETAYGRAIQAFVRVLNLQSADDRVAWFDEILARDAAQVGSRHDLHGLAPEPSISFDQAAIAWLEGSDPVRR